MSNDSQLSLLKYDPLNETGSRPTLTVLHAILHLALAVGSQVERTFQTHPHLGYCKSFDAEAYHSAPPSLPALISRHDIAVSGLSFFDQANLIDRPAQTILRRESESKDL
jgi:hypothetical protein